MSVRTWVLVSRNSRILGVGIMAAGFCTGVRSSFLPRSPGVCSCPWRGSSVGESAFTFYESVSWVTVSWVATLKVLALETFPSHWLDVRVIAICTIPCVHWAVLP